MKVELSQLMDYAGAIATAAVGFVYREIQLMKERINKNSRDLAVERTQSDERHKAQTQRLDSIEGKIDRLVELRERELQERGRRGAD